MANKKITELPFINTITGSSVWDNPNYNSVVPVVLYGTTNQITVENFAKHINLYNAHTGSAGNTFAGPQTINNNVTINGRLTVREVVTQYETASVLFSTGSTKLGDEITDKHELTGSTNITGSLVYNGVLIGNIDSNTIYRLQQSTASIELASASFKYFYQSTSSLQSFTASQADRNLVLSTVTGSINQATQSLQTFTASQDSRNFVLGIVTGSLNQFTASQDVRNFTLGIVTGSLNQFTASQDSRNFVISQYTASTDAHIVGIAAFTSSQLAVNLGNSIYTASVDSHIVGISTYTSSVRDTLARVYQSTASLQQFTASQDGRNFVVSQVTGSLIGITNGLMAFTAALDNTYATDAQLYQLYQATRSIELHSGSMIGVTNGLMAYTSSNETWKTGVRGEINGIEAYTASLKAAAIVSSSTQIQNYDLFALNSNLYIATGSIKGEIAGIESYTASLKAAAIVSSSTQITNYYKFAETASANTFYGNQTFNNDVRANKFVFTDGVVSQNVGGQNIIGTSGNILYLYTGTSGLYINNQANNAQNVTISDAGVVGIRGALTVGSSGNDQNIIFGGSNSILDWAGTGAKVQYSVGALQFSSVGTTNNMILQMNAGALFNAGITGSLMATNGVVSSSQQIQNYNKFALTASANTFYGTQSVTGSVRISGSIDDISYIDFDTVAPATAVARLGWDDGEGTLTIGLSGGNVNIPIGVTGFETAYNEDSSSISKGDVVRISGAQGNRVAIKKANNHNDAGSATTIALAAETIGVGAEGKIIESGPLKGINTTAFGEGDLLYLSSTPGGITNIKPHPPYHEVRIGVAQRIHASVGIINVKVDNGYEIDELHNVLIHTASLANKQLLAYSGSVWANQTISQLGIATTGSNSFFGSQTVSGSLIVTGSLLVTGSVTISSGSITMPNRPAFRVVGTSTSDRTGVYTMSGSNFTIDYNEGNHFNITNGKFTAPIAGLYQVYLNARCGSVNAQQQIIVYKNGTAGTTQLMWETPGNTGVAHFGVSSIVKLSAGDTLEATITVGSISFDGNDSWGVTYIG